MRYDDINIEMKPTSEYVTVDEHHFRAATKDEQRAHVRALMAWHGIEEPRPGMFDIVADHCYPKLAMPVTP